MDSLHTAIFDPGGINADGPDASVSSPSKRTSRDTTLRMSSLLEPTTTGAQYLDATKASRDWITAEDIQSIAEAGNEHTGSDVLSLSRDYQEHFYTLEPVFVKQYHWSEYAILLPLDKYNPESNIRSRLKKHEADDLKRKLLRIMSVTSFWIPFAIIAGILFPLKLSWSQLRFTYGKILLHNPSFNTSWVYLLKHVNHPPASCQLLDHHVRELPCANYPPLASGQRPP
jgi:hypothetical protein